MLLPQFAQEAHVPVKAHSAVPLHELLQEATQLSLAAQLQVPAQPLPQLATQVPVPAQA